MYINVPEFINNQKHSSYYRGCNCSPVVNNPSIKGPLYWNSPKFIPDIYKAKAVGNKATPDTDIVTFSTIEHCMKKYTYIWLKDGKVFWSVPISEKNEFINLWMWNMGQWVFTKIPLANLDCFMCY